MFLNWRAPMWPKRMLTMIFTCHLRIITSVHLHMTPTAKHTTLLPNHYKLPLDKIQPLFTRINTFKIEGTKVHSSLYRNIYRLHKNRCCKWLQNDVDSTTTLQVRSRLHWLESPWFIHFCFILMQNQFCSGFLLTKMLQQWGGGHLTSSCFGFACAHVQETQHRKDCLVPCPQLIVIGRNLLQCNGVVLV
jgi:hypothetical protein